ncbi:MAG: hypothetical protein ACE5GU_05715 [Candidatus Scalinduaceae bacterium]
MIEKTKIKDFIVLFFDNKLNPPCPLYQRSEGGLQIQTYFPLSNISSNHTNVCTARAILTLGLHGIYTRELAKKADLKDE